MVVVLDQETGEKIAMSKLAYENLVFYDDKGRYLLVSKKREGIYCS